MAEPARALLPPPLNAADPARLDFRAALRLLGRNLGGETLHVICRTCGLGWVQLVTPGRDLPSCCATCSSRDILLTRAVDCCQTRPQARLALRH